MIDPTRPDAFAQRLLDGVADGVYLVNRRREITFWNRSAERITGYDRNEVRGRRCMDNLLMHVDESGRELCRSQCPLLATIVDGEERTSRLWLRHADGHRVPVRVRTAPVRDDDGRIVGGMETFDDDTALLEAVAHAVDKVQTLEELAMTDVLTGLPNRRAFEQAAETRLDDVRRHGTPLGLLVVDIDRFHDVNTAHGYGTGDEALKMVSRTIAGSRRAGDFLARWGGEEFCILAWSDDDEDAGALAERVRSLVAASVLPTGDADLRLTVSVGFALATPLDTVASLFLRASDATLLAKARGRNQVAAA